MPRPLIDEVRSRHAPGRLFTLWRVASGETASERLGREVSLRWEQAAEDFLQHLAGLEGPGAIPRGPEIEIPATSSGGRNGSGNLEAPASAEERAEPARGTVEAPGRRGLGNESHSEGTAGRRKVHPRASRPAASSRRREESFEAEAGPVPDSAGAPPGQARRGDANPRKWSALPAGGAGAGETAREGLLDPGSPEKKPSAPGGAPDRDPFARRRVAREVASRDGLRNGGARDELHPAHPREWDVEIEPALEFAARDSIAPPLDGIAAPHSSFPDRSTPGLDRGGEPPRFGLPGLVELDADAELRARLVALFEERARRAESMREWEGTQF